MRIYCCQFDVVWENKGANFARVGEMLRAAKPAAGSMVILPEMFATGFSPNLDKVAEEEAGATGAFLEKTAKELGIYLAGGVAQRGAGGKVENRAVVVDAAGRLLASYAKLQPFHPGGEKTAAGNEVVTFSFGQFTASPFVCYDLRFPEIFRRAVSRGAELLLVIANWPTSRLGHWTALLRARAIENQAYVAGVNRCGSDPKLIYGGKSAIIDPRGEILAEAEDGAVVLGAELDWEGVRKYRREFLALGDVREEFLGMGKMRG